MNKFTKKAMAALVLGLGLLTACTSNDEPNDKGGVVEGSTYMSVAINLSTANSTRADGQEDETGDPEYNNVGKWAGKDKIEGIDVYVFNDGGALEVTKQFTTGEFEVKAADTDKSVTIAPSKGIKVEKGAKTVYVVVNPNQKTRDLLSAAANLTDFEKKYKNVASTPGDFFVPGNTGHATVDVKTAADNIAKVDTDNKDVIVMTAVEAGSVNVVENVSESATLTGDATNRAKLKVKRAVARVMVSTIAETFDVKGDDFKTPNTIETEFVVGKISNIHFVVGQGENSMYFMQFKNAGNADLTYQTPNSAWVPNKAGAVYDWATAGDKYDYSGLWKGHSISGISGIKVPTKTLFNADPNTTLGNITTEMKDQLNGEFILPNTHKWGADQDASDYRKGNTAYVLVRATYTPTQMVMADGSINKAVAPGTTFYRGANGVCYETREVAKDPKKHGVAGQETSMYEKGKTLYYAWINPDKKTTGWLNSPVNRNNIYHIEISGFKRIGTNWNPLVPAPDPSKPEDNPNNPDPKPNDPNEPDTPPVDPNDPLTPKETWMSVQTKILPWNVHSYSVVLDI